MRAFVPLYIATVREFTRDTTAVFWNLAFPILFMLVSGLAFTGEGDISFAIGVVNQDGEASAPLVTVLQQVEVFDVTTGNLDDELGELEDGDRTAVIVIPPGTGAAMTNYLDELRRTGSISESVPASLAVYTDPADQRTSQVVLSVMDKVIAGMSAGITRIPPVMTIESRSVSSENFRYLDYLMPGVLAMSLMQLGLMGTAEPLVSLREKQVLRRMGATPLTKGALLASQVLFRLTIAVISTALIILIAIGGFGIHIEMGNIIAISGVVILGAALFITMGYFLSGLARTEQSIQGIVALPYFIFMFLSGIFFPLDWMPGWIRPFIDLIPLTYLGDALREVMIEAGSYYSMTRNVGTMAVWLVVCAVLAVRFFRWEPQA